MAVIVLLGGACKSSGTSTQTYGVQVDGRSSEFLASYLAYFPTDVQVHPGDRIDFTSVYGGEPHTVTLGKDVNDLFALEAQACPNGVNAPPCDQGPPAQYAAQANTLAAQLPALLPNGPGDVVQAAGQPCFLGTGHAPSDGSACAAAQQKQSNFDGTQTYYNSGFLPDKAVFSVKLADTIVPGTYHYFCLLHRETMSGTITVVDKKTKVPAPSEVKKTGDDQLSAIVAKLKPAADALKSLTSDKAQAGALSQTVQNASINQFGPGAISIPVGGSVTWTFYGPHTISFNAPADAQPLLTKSADGSHHANTKAVAPAGGPGAPATPGLIDGGSWDGSSAFRSTGVIVSFPPSLYSYKLTFTKAGTYNYVCLIHPGMVGSVKVQ